MPGDRDKRKSPISKDKYNTDKKKDNRIKTR